VTTKVGRRLGERWRRLRPFLGHVSRWRLFALVSSSAGSGLLEAGLLAFVSQIAFALASGSPTVALPVVGAGRDGGLPMGPALLVALVLVVVRLLLQLVVSALPARMSAEVQEKLRAETFDLFIGSTWETQARERDGHLQSLLGQEIARASDAVLRLGSGLAASFNFLALIVAAVLLNAVVALTILVASIGLFFALRPLSRLARRRSAELVRTGRTLLGAVSDTVRMAEEIAVFGRGATFSDRYGELAHAMRRPYFMTQFLQRSVRALYQSVGIGVVVAGLGVLYLLGSEQLAEIGAVVLILVRALTYGQELQGTYHGFLEGAPYFESVRTAQASYRAHPAVWGDEPAGRIGTLAFEDVSFAYVPGRPVLRDLTFEIGPGEAVGVVGPSGAGKSTLIQVLLRLRPPMAGRYLVDGRDADRLSVGDWTRRLAYLPQDSRVVSATVAENIRFFRPDVDHAQVVRAARLAGIHDEITSWAEGYDTVIGQRADAVSGGQRQRLCLARALAADPDVLILDEPTSALDLSSESVVQEALARLTGRVTVLIVAHRLSTLSICDRIMVLRDGRIEAFDRPQAVADVNPFYREALLLSQSSQVSLET
jgi:ABC-type multidrug transport system fused ATPase/permease subunit